MANTDNEYVKIRKQKIENLKELGINSYAYSFDKRYSTAEALELKVGTKKVKTAGRLMLIRDMGRLCFAHIQDEAGKIQIAFNEKELGKESYKLFIKNFDLGDFIGVEGEIFQTHKGETTILVKKFEMLTKAVQPLPEKWHGITDKEERYRRRYLDLIMNPEVRVVFEKRSQVINAMRDFMISRGYFEVQTPILQPIYGGGSARPFKSNLNALDMDVYMRISNEMYLKRLVVGGFEKIFEFSIDFRNEGIDRSHNPEFLLFEAMTAYDDYFDGMDLIEDLTVNVVKKVNGSSTKINYQGRDIDFKKPWTRISIRDALIKYAKVDIEKTNDKELGEILKKNHIKLTPFDRGNAIMTLVEEFCEEKFIQPTILCDYPIETSPLAKPKRDDPRYAERFEHFINGFEVGNHYSELNNPEILRKNWEKQEEILKKGDINAQKMDEDFLNALEVGMPPTCGIGIGVDRLIMLLTDQPSIRDVILFPFMKPTE